MSDKPEVKSDNLVKINLTNDSGDTLNFYKDAGSRFKNVVEVRIEKQLFVKSAKIESLEQKLEEKYAQVNEWIHRHDELKQANTKLEITIKKLNSTIDIHVADYNKLLEFFQRELPRIDKILRTAKFTPRDRIAAEVVLEDIEKNAELFIKQIDHQQSKASE